MSVILSGGQPNIRAGARSWILWLFWGKDNHLCCVVRAMLEAGLLGTSLKILRRCRLQRIALRGVCCCARASRHAVTCVGRQAGAAGHASEELAVAGSCEDSWVPTTHTFSQVHGVLSSGGLGLGLGVPVSSRLELGGDPSVSSTSDIRMPRFCKPQVTYFLLRKSKMCAFVPPPPAMWLCLSEVGSLSG